MSDFDYFYAERVRRALFLRDGVVDFDLFYESLLEQKREFHGLPKSSSWRLEI